MLNTHTCDPSVRSASSDGLACLHLTRARFGCWVSATGASGVAPEDSTALDARFRDTLGAGACSAFSRRCIGMLHFGLWDLGGLATTFARSFPSPLSLDLSLSPCPCHGRVPPDPGHHPHPHRPHHCLLSWPSSIFGLPVQVRSNTYIKEVGTVNYIYSRYRMPRPLQCFHLRPYPPVGGCLRTCSQIAVCLLWRLWNLVEQRLAILVTRI